MYLQRTLITSFWLAATAVSLLAQNKTVAERLGYPADAKLLIIHAEDLGLEHSIDEASFAALNKRAVTSASVLAPCPWLTEVADYVKRNPDTDLGVDLTVTSEWKTYRWSPIEPRDRVPSLLDPNGYMWGTAALAANHVESDEVEREIHAQIERTLAIGIRPTHLDVHMGSLYATRGLFAAFVKTAHYYKLPFFALRVSDKRSEWLSLLSEKDVVLDALIAANDTVPAGNWKDFYANAVKNLKPGLTEMMVHLGHDTPELQAITADHSSFGASWRQRDLDVVFSTDFKKALEESHVILISWKDLKTIMQ